MSREDSNVEVDTDSEDDGYCDYYNYEHCEESTEPEKTDPEHFEFECFTKEEVEKLLNENVEVLCANLPIKPSAAKLLLHLHGWAIPEIIASYNLGASQLLIDSGIKPPEIESKVVRSSRFLTCSVCLLMFPRRYFSALDCGHYFCEDCWIRHFEMQIFQGITATMKCMSCSLLVPEDFVLSILNKPSLREKYQVFLLSDYVKSHPSLRYCLGPNCELIIFAKECQSKRVICKECKVSFCFKCGTDYHAPTDCDTIKKWLTKCADDSETANYISAYTKDCPNCHVCIEKNGGCNHMRCSDCKYDFCWMCLGDWKSHCDQYYACSKYKENSNIANESAATQAREALKRYVFCFERWENHAMSLKLEEVTLQKLKDRIDKKVAASEGTWIDWQYLKDAAALLAKCRYTLQYTYPYAYFMESGPRKELFEYQQAQLEAVIENLSWKIERAETTDRGDLENQMDVAEKRRETLLKDFLTV